MSGLYIHVPFCNEKCFYCDFYSGNQLYLIDDYIDSVVREIKLRSNYISGNQIDTIYFGGGTPSLLKSKQIAKVLKEVYSNFDVNSHSEITIEFNPENVSKDYLLELYDLGVNRISLGVQFLDDDLLLRFNRNHTKDLIINALNIISISKFKNLSIDLMYSVPGLTNENLMSSLIQLMKYDIKHISTYSLTIAKNSKLYWKILNKEFKENSEETFLTQYKIINEYLNSMDFIQYEISNYAKEGFYSVHNMSYWNQVPYIGVGVSAHSYNKVSRQWNFKNIKKYIRDLKVDLINFESEQLTENQIYNEYIILKLRTFQGLSFNYIKDSFNVNIYKHFLIKIYLLRKRNHFIFENDLVIPKSSDLLIADYLAKELIY